MSDIEVRVRLRNSQIEERMRLRKRSNLWKSEIQEKVTFRNQIEERARLKNESD